MSKFSALIGKLEAWKDYEFHADRQLSDEVLIADGWQCEPDASFVGGVRWFHSIVSVAEDHRPHVMNDLNTALGVVPYKYNVCLMIVDGEAKATVWAPGEATGHEGKSRMPTIAILIAALKAKEAA